MSGFIGDLSSTQAAALVQFKNALSDVLKPEHDDHYCLRWLRARDFDLKKSELMLRNHFQWRKKHGADTILEDYQPPEVFTKYFTGGYSGNDKEGALLWIDAIGGLDMKGMMRAMKTSDIYRSKLHYLENVYKQFKEESARRGHRMDQIVVVNDLKNFGLGHLYRPGLAAMTEVFTMYEENYPETIKRIFIVNAPSIFPIAWKIIRPFMSDATAKKFVILGSDYKTKLLECIDAAQLPTSYGGNCVDADGDPRCKSKIGYGGKVPESYYLKVTAADLENFTQAKIQRGSSLPIECIVKIPGSVIRWNFTTSGHDLGFGIYCRTADTFQKWDMMESIMEPQRVNSHLVPEDGSITCEKLGTYVLRFDNSYSWTRGKELHYLIEVLEPGIVGTPTVSALQSLTAQLHLSSIDADKGTQVVVGQSLVDEEHEHDVLDNPSSPE